MSDAYHHGDLRAALIDAALLQLREHGPEHLTLRKLAERVGVSRSGAYHHFDSKNELLCAVAGEGFAQLRAMMPTDAAEDARELEACVRAFVRDYVAFASREPALYELMFGRGIWRVGGATDELKAVAHGCFGDYADWVERVMGLGQPRRERRACLRVAQANWAAIHGLCRLSLDGVYLQSASLDELVEVVADSIVRALRG